MKLDVIVPLIFVLLIYGLVGLSIFQSDEFNGREEKMVSCYDKLGNEIEGLECKQEAIEVSELMQIIIIAVYTLGGILILIPIWIY